MAAKIFLAVLSVHTGSAASTLYYASGPGFVSKPSDTPANTVFEPRLIQPVVVRRDAFAPGRIMGGSRAAAGDLILNNADGSLDTILSYGFDGRDLTIYKGDPVNDAFPADWDVVFKGTMEGVEYDRFRVIVKARDRQFDTQQPIQSTLYAGTGGLEGSTNDLLGKPKPILRGKVYNITPPAVDTTNFIYQVRDGEVLDTDKVYVAGAELTKASSYSSLADLSTGTAPASTEFRTLSTAGYFRLGADPTGEVTADVTEGDSSSVRTIAQVWQNLLIDGGKSSTDVESAAVTAADTANSAEVGIYLGTEPTILSDALDQVTNSGGFWWGQNSSRKFTIARLELAGATTEVTAYTESDILSLERVPTNAIPLPVWRTVVGYQRNYTRQTAGQLSTAVSLSRRGFLANEYRTVTASASTVQTQFLNSPTLHVPTLLIDSTAASTEATRLQTLHGSVRNLWNARVPLTTTVPDLGDVVKLTVDRFGLSTGKTFRVLGVGPDARRNALELTFWGGE